MFDSLSSKFSSAFSSLRKKGKIKPGDIDEIVLEIKSALIDSDVALEVAEKFADRIKERSLAELEQVNRGTNPSQAIFESVSRKC